MTAEAIAPTHRLKVDIGPLRAGTLGTVEHYETESLPEGVVAPEVEADLSKYTGGFTHFFVPVLGPDHPARGLLSDGGGVVVRESEVGELKAWK